MSEVEESEAPKRRGRRTKAEIEADNAAAAEVTEGQTDPESESESEAPFDKDDPRIGVRYDKDLGYTNVGFDDGTQYKINEHGFVHKRVI